MSKESDLLQLSLVFHPNAARLQTPQFWARFVPLSLQVIFLGLKRVEQWQRPYSLITHLGSRIEALFVFILTAVGLRMLSTLAS
jgi:hypothetical protein